MSVGERYRFLLALGLLMTLAGGLRWRALSQAHFILDGDEAVTGLMARHLTTRGEFAFFLYGQPYMAPTDAWIAAPFMAFIDGPVWVKAGPFLWSVAFVGLNGWMAWLFFESERAGVLAALLTALPPLYFLVNDLRAWGSYAITPVLGNLLFMLAYALVFRQPAPRRAAGLWFLLGLAAGFGFYAFWLIAFYYIPIAFFLLLKDKRFFMRPGFGFGLAGFGVGSLPLWWYNFETGFATFRYFAPKPGGDSIPAAQAFTFFLTDSLPRVIGMRPTGGVINWMLCALWIAIGFGWLMARWRGGRSGFTRSLCEARPVDMLLLLGVTAPMLLWASGVIGTAFVLPDVDTTGRYLLPLMGAAPVLAGGAFARLAEWSAARRVGTRAAAAGVIGMLLGHMLPYPSADFVALSQSPYYTILRPPLDNRPVIDYLRSQGIEYATCNHWVGNRLMLESDETIKCVDYYDVRAGGVDRFPALTATLREPGRRIAFVLVNPSRDPTPLEARLRALGVDFTRRDLAPYAIIIPTSRPVAPDEVVAALGYPY